MMNGFFCFFFVDTDTKDNPKCQPWHNELLQLHDSGEILGGFQGFVLGT